MYYGAVPVVVLASTYRPSLRQLSHIRKRCTLNRAITHSDTSSLRWDHHHRLFAQSRSITLAMSKGKNNSLRQFPRNKFVTSWRLPRSKSTSPQHKRQVRNKLACAKVRCVCCVVSFPKFHYNDLTCQFAKLLRTCSPCR